jgi:aryl-alcohol dehydrogenase-like predicted oxidoreductase
VFSTTRDKGVGVLNMFAVRRALSQPERLKTIVADLIQKRALSSADMNVKDLVDFMLRESNAQTLPEVAYRFCRHEIGVDVVLTGTGNPEHLRANVQSILKPALPKPVLEKLEAIFGRLDTLTGN